MKFRHSHENKNFLFSGRVKSASCDRRKKKFVLGGGKSSRKPKIFGKQFQNLMDSGKILIFIYYYKNKKRLKLALNISIKNNIS